MGTKMLNSNEIPNNLDILLSNSKCKKNLC